jgi:hypothetical protein
MTAPKSIWGDTNLKALAREVENDVSVLFTSSDAALETAPFVSETSATQENVTLPDQSVSAEENADIEDQVCADPSTEALIHTKPSKVGRRTRGADPILSAPSQRRKKKTIATESTPALSLKDELALLERENHDLKRRLSEVLRVENAALALVLRRFEQVFVPND